MHVRRMAWQLIFKALEPEDEGAWAIELDRTNPWPRKPVSMTVQLEPGTSGGGASGDEDEEDD